MRGILCWLLGHDRMETGARQRVCLRCGQRETRQQYGSVVAWLVSAQSELPRVPQPRPRR